MKQKHEHTADVMAQIESLMESLLSRAIIDGETDVLDGQYRLVLANRSAWLYQAGCLVHRADLDSDMLGDQTPEFMSRVGLC